MQHRARTRDRRRRQHEPCANVPGAGRERGAFDALAGVRRGYGAVHERVLPRSERREAEPRRFAGVGAACAQGHEPVSRPVLLERVRIDRRCTGRRVGGFESLTGVLNIAGSARGVLTTRNSSRLRGLSCRRQIVAYGYVQPTIGGTMKSDKELMDSLLEEIYSIVSGPDAISKLETVRSLLVEAIRTRRGEFGCDVDAVSVLVDDDAVAHKRGHSRGTP